ncbi:MAG: electron transport complex subunit RsxE [Kiritimatiellia bacterium]
MSFYRQFVKGLWEEIPIFRVVLGMCPTLAVSTSLENGIGMGVAASFVLICSNVVIAALRKLIPSKVRIPCYIVIAATFVTIVDLSLNAFAHSLHKALGIFIPLIVVNCIILGRAEAFAGKNSVLLSFADGLGMGIGFTLALSALATVRELLGNGTITVWGNLAWKIPSFQPALIMILAPGGFVALGCILAVMNRINAFIAKRQGKGYAPPAELSCRHCIICKWGA